MATPEAPLREILKSISFTQLPLRHIEPFFTPEPIDTPRLFIYRTERPGLPTHDIECLRVLTLLKFANYGFDIAYTHEAGGSPDGRLPYLLLPDGRAIDAQGVPQHLDESGHSLPERSLVDDLAYRTMVERNLIPAAEYVAWVDPAGFEAIGSARYLGRYPAAIQYLLGWIRSSKAAHDVRVGQPEYGAALDGEVLYENALRTLNPLLELLGDREYLAGAPSILDAQVVACLNFFIESPVKSPVRSALVRPDSKYKPLADYALRLLDRHL
ncbi:hypothetical protein GGF46_003404 [Coemansia sp. RSA 552]|nr:hypothetical protein GGF46_003404 [Coemansia sp. RSA 552]